MGTWDELQSLIGQAEQAIFRLRLGGLARTTSVLRDETTGMYSREYLAFRLPAEVYRFHQSGRPFSLALIRVPARALEDGEKWGRLFSTFLRPMDTPIRYGESDVLILFPETDAAGAVERIQTLADGIALLGLCRRSEILAGVASSGREAAPDSTLSSGSLLEELEKSVAKVDVVAAEVERSAVEIDDPAGDARASSAGDSADAAAADSIPIGGTADPSGVDAAADPPEWGREADEQVAVSDDPPVAPSEAIVAVGFAADRSRPVSFWRDGELRRIQAVLDDTNADKGVLVMTDAGPFYLRERSGRWYARPYAD